MFSADGDGVTDGLPDGLTDESNDVWTVMNVPGFLDIQEISYSMYFHCEFS